MRRYGQALCLTPLLLEINTMRNFAKFSAIVALSLASAAASATGLGGVVVIGGAAGGYAGSVTGNASSYSDGNAIAASQVNGYGSSFQHTDGFSGGSATVGGHVNNVGANIVTGTTQYAQTNSYGNVTGNAPIMAGESIANGTAGFAKNVSAAGGTGNFQTAQIGGFVGIGAIGAFGHF